MKSKSKNRIFDQGVRLLIFLLFQYIFFSQIAYAEVNGLTAAGEPPQNVQGETPIDQANLTSPKTLQAPELKQNFEKTAKELQRLRQSLADVEQENQRLKKDAEKRPQTDITQATALNESSVAAKKELENLKTRLASLQDENKALKNNGNIKWFMAGGGVFLSGWLIGFAVGSMKKKRSLLL